MKANIAIVLAVVAVLIATFQGTMPKFSAITGTSYFDYFNAATGGGFQINGTTVLNANTLKTTTAGGTLTVTTSNTATSTAIIGCWQTYATSTATAVKLQATGTPGVAFWQYGTCP